MLSTKFHINTAYRRISATTKNPVGDMFGHVGIVVALGGVNAQPRNVAVAGTPPGRGGFVGSADIGCQPNGKYIGLPAVPVILPKVIRPVPGGCAATHGAKRAVMVRCVVWILETWTRTVRRVASVNWAEYCVMPITPRISVVFTPCGVI